MSSKAFTIFLPTLFLHFFVIFTNGIIDVMLHCYCISFTRRSVDRRSQVFRQCWDYISTEIPDHRTDLCIYDLVRSNHFLVLVTSRLICEYRKHSQMDIYILVFQCNTFLKPSQSNFLSIHFFCRFHFLFHIQQQFFGLQF